jgi:sortase A
MNEKMRKILGIVLVAVGLVLVVVVFYPIADYWTFSKQNFPNLLSPLPSDDSAQGLLDYRRASNWFADGLEGEDFVNEKVNYYTISIPSLDIEKATVSIGGEDLSENLIHYPGTAVPGKSGNSVIFGHSVLPIFYDPKDYLAIFSTLPSLKKGSKVEVNYDGVYYEYRVEDMFEVSPYDIEIMKQASDDSYLTLVTCTPPGDPRKPKRLIVRAKIVPFN